ncbi:radical SAM family heme chaperone HemW [Bartonella sp. DGB1]|uniref:radical SAM family heme chaperone HemW n=1 Tax=Bartonella sp. DGB1 TaxID=3239807 RepID=UPI003526C359
MLDKSFGIYIHWPFCAFKCPYCDFNSHVRRREIDQKIYAQAYAKELQFMAMHTGSRKVTSIFIGGGTPSLMEPATLEIILDNIYKYWSVSDKVEITLEANPTSVEANKFYQFNKLGVNRLSLGVQALNDNDLIKLGRKHSVKQALYAIETARDIFNRLSFDLIYARPEQTLEQWQEELNYAIDLAADHLSLYQLTIEPNTHFYYLYKADKLKMLNEEEFATLYEETQKITQARGLIGYEISNYAKPGAESIHNLLYWQYGDYIGVGAGAHGRFIKDTPNKYVTITEKLPERWLNLVLANGHGIVEEETLTPQQQGDELLLMGLRLRQGVDLSIYEKLTGKKLDKLTNSLQKQGLVNLYNKNWLQVTPKGRLLVDYILKCLVY